MPRKKKSEPATGEYEVIKGKVTYGDDKIASLGDVVTDLPSGDIAWLEEQGYIKRLHTDDAEETPHPRVVKKTIESSLELSGEGS